MRTALRLAGSVTTRVTLYYPLPLDHAFTLAAVTILIAGLAALATLVTFQVRWIIRFRHPGLRAVEALGRRPGVSESSRRANAIRRAWRSNERRKAWSSPWA